MSIMTFQSLGRSITKHLGLYAFGSIIVGVVIGNYGRPEFLKILIPVALFMMLYPMMLDVKLGDLGEILKRPGLLGIALIMNFAVSPLIMIVLPMGLADITRRITIKMKGVHAFQNLKGHMKDVSSLGLMILLFIIFMLNGKLVLNEPGIILKIVFPVFSFLTALLVFSMIICKKVRSYGKDAIAFTISVCAKNNALSLALALSLFGANVGLVNAIAGPMVQFPFMLIWLRLTRFMSHTRG